MGGRTSNTGSKQALTKSQKDRIAPNSEGGEWVATIDPITGAIKYIRKKIKFKK